MAGVMGRMMIMQLLGTIVMLGVLGGVGGFVFGRLFANKSAKGGKKPAAAPKQTKQPPNEESKRRLAQLKEQLDSGLITKEEYREKREALLKE